MNNFIPELYSDMLMVQRPEETVFAKLCTTEYNGEIENYGDRVYVTGIGRPTIRTWTAEGSLTAEYMNGSVVELDIDQAKYFDVKIDDMDKKQGKIDPTNAIIVGARQGFAENMDAYIGTLRSQAGTSVTETQLTATNVIEKISNGITQLYKNNVPTSEEINLVVSPDIAEKIMISDIIFNTGNSETLQNGWIGRMKKFINARVWMSNNVYESGNVDYCMLFTKGAIALAEQVPPGLIERLRSESYAADIIRGFHLFGAKVIRPKELVSLAFTPVEEA